jgi:hypothetical protein
MQQISLGFSPSEVSAAALTRAAQADTARRQTERAAEQTAETTAADAERFRDLAEQATARAVRAEASLAEVRRQLGHATAAGACCRREGDRART